MVQPTNARCVDGCESVKKARNVVLMDSYGLLLLCSTSALSVYVYGLLLRRNSIIV